MATVAEVIHAAAERLEAAGVEDARLETEVLFAHARRTWNVAGWSRASNWCSRTC
jgi:hypothetical protein